MTEISALELNELKIEIREKQRRKETVAKQLHVLQKLAEMDLKKLRLYRKYPTLFERGK